MVAEIFIAGENRKLGCLPRVAKVGEQFPVFKDEWLIPRSKWQPVSRREWVPEIRDQRNQGCHDEATEVLTDAGWVSWGNYNKHSLLATVNPYTLNLEFQRPLAFHAYEYDGEMISIDRRGLTFCVTPNHRMMVRSWNERQRRIVDEFGFREASNVGWYGRMLASPKGFAGSELTSVTIGGRVYDGDDFVALVSLVLSDGWISGSDTNKNHVSYCCFREDRIEMVRALTARLGLHELPGRAGVVTWTDAELHGWLKENAYTGNNLKSPFKRLPQSFRQLGKRQAELFLLFYGDQHEGDNGRQFYTSSRQMADDLQELILRTGRRAAINIGKPAGHVTYIKGRKIVSKHDSYTITEWTSDEFSIEKKKLESSHYRGYVFCATVPNSTLVTRRNGTVLISGNSCNAHSSVMTMRVLRLLAGKKDVRLSEGNLYGQINGQRDQGSLLGDALEALVKTGVCLDTTIGEYDWQKSKWPANWQAEAKNYRIQEAWDCSTFDHIASAIQLGFIVNYGIMVYDDFGPDSENWAVPPSRRGGGGHAMPAIGLAVRNGVWGVETPNSWGTRFADNGIIIVPETYFTNTPFTDGWACRQVIEESSDPLS